MLDEDATQVSDEGVIRTNIHIDESDEEELTYTLLLAPPKMGKYLTCVYFTLLTFLLLSVLIA